MRNLHWENVLSWGPKQLLEIQLTPFRNSRVLLSASQAVHSIALTHSIWPFHLHTANSETNEQDVRFSNYWGSASCLPVLVEMAKSSCLIVVHSGGRPDPYLFQQRCQGECMFAALSKKIERQDECASNSTLQTHNFQFLNSTEFLF